MNEDIVHTNRKIAKQNEEMINEIKRKERARLNRNRANRQTYMRNVWRYNNDVNEAERRILQVFNVRQRANENNEVVINNEQD